MNVIFFGSPLNPLSAIVAYYLYKERMLKCIVLPQKSFFHLPKGGYAYFISLAIVGVYRYFQVLLRKHKLKKSENYESFYEFIIDNSNIPIVFFSQDFNVFEGSLSEILGKIVPTHYLILSCIFPAKIPLNILDIRRAINIHPGKLPDNRGPNPYFWAIVNGQKVSTVTFHVMSNKFDRGNILFTKSIPICSKDSEYSVEMKTRQVLKESLPIFFTEFEHFWKSQCIQQGGHYYKEPNFEDRKKYRRFSIINLRDAKRLLLFR